MKKLLRNRLLSWVCFSLAGLPLSGLAQAQVSAVAAVQHNVAQLSVTAMAEASQDQLLIVLATTREGPTAAQVQTQLSQAVETALAMARQASQPGQLEVRSGGFSLQPRHNRDGQLTGWQGTSQVLLEGRDFVRITALAGRINTLSVSQVSFSLSPEAQARLKTEAQAKAIAQFKRNAEEVARGFGLSGYTLREVSVNQQDAGPWPVVRPMAAQARLAAVDAPLPVEAGKGSVSVTVSGSVQMH